MRANVKMSQADLLQAQVKRRCDVNWWHTARDTPKPRKEGVPIDWIIVGIIWTVVGLVWALGRPA